MKLRGAGTEKTEDEIRSLLPHAKILRLDRDVAQDAETYDEILQKMRRKECNILVGTQMIAKGHDLPEVTLAAVVDCDVGLHMPDFRAGERVFQLLSQLAGRAGRGDKKGTVLLQTRVPKHPSIHFTKHHDFKGFAKYELENRKSLTYPPYGRLLRIVCSSSVEVLPEESMSKLRRAVKLFVEHAKCELTILGPTPCPIQRIKNEWRWHMLIKSDHSLTLVKLLSALKSTVDINRKVKVIYDLDPQDML